MAVSTEQIKKLRALTSAGVMECKKVLEETGGDFDRAQELLIERAAKQAEKKAERSMQHGLLDAYIHGNGRIGVLVEVHCETDFLSKSEPFRSLVRDIALQIASEAPEYIHMSDVPQEVIDQVALEAEQEAREEGKPERVIGQIREGKVRKFLEERCLMEQRFIKDSKLTVGDLIRTFIGRSGENVRIEFFARRQLGA